LYDGDDGWASSGGGDRIVEVTAATAEQTAMAAIRFCRRCVTAATAEQISVAAVDLVVEGRRGRLPAAMAKGFFFFSRRRRLKISGGGGGS
jgi:hypothetical protein